MIIAKFNVYLQQTSDNNLYFFGDVFPQKSDINDIDYG